MRLMLQRHPDATFVSVAHRVELEAFHTRKLALEYRREGARLIDDAMLGRAVGRVARFLSSVWNSEKIPKVPHAVR